MERPFLKFQTKQIGQASPQALGLQVFQGILALGSPQSNKLKPLN
tara:strand:+ start:1689 stop:1823 length:135 start_codon:yes stop_codon:yes gene_type:complete